MVNRGEIDEKEVSKQEGKWRKKGGPAYFVFLFINSKL